MKNWLEIRKQIEREQPVRPMCTRILGAAELWVKLQ